MSSTRPFPRCRTILIVGADNLRTGLRPGRAVTAYAMMRHPTREVPYGLTNPGAYALLAQAHAARYATTDEQRAAVAVAIRKWAGLNPRRSTEAH